MHTEKEKVNIYISYSHKDGEYADEFLKHLNVLKRSGSIDEIYIDKHMLQGSNWSNEMRKYFEDSSIIVFLLSPDFFESSYIKSTEVPDALRKYKKGEIEIFPILVRPVDFEKSELSRFVLPHLMPVLKGKDKAWSEILKALTIIIDGITSKAAVKIIEQVKKSNAKILDLGNCGLNKIPLGVYELDWLEVLILGNGDQSTQMGFFTELNNKLPKDYPRYPWFTKNMGAPNDFSRVDIKELSRLKNLRLLNFENCGINIFNFDSLSLTKLTVLLAGNNSSLFSKKEIINEQNKSFIKQYPSLKVVNLCRSNITTLPSGLLNAIGNPIEYLNISLNPALNIPSRTTLKNFTKIISLNIESNNLGNNLPIEEFENLLWLNLARNDLSNVSVIKNIPSIKVLYLNNNSISDISSLSNLRFLSKLDLSNNNISDLSPLKNLTDLEILYVGNNQVSDIEALKSLKKMQDLNISSNKIGRISAIDTMVKLKTLNAEHNVIFDIKPLIRNKSLETMNISRNAIKDINDIKTLTSKLPKLGTLHIEENPISSIDPSLLYRFRTPDDFKNYFKEHEKGFKLTHEVKLILVGNSTVGKSTLRRMIQDNSYEDNEGTTHGIIKDTWEIPSSIAGQPDLKVNIWDFGGQEYYHETHKLFFSKNAVYVLMWEKQTNRNDILETEVSYKDDYNKIVSNKNYIEHYSYEYWLNNIRHYGADCPVIIVQNKIDLVPNRIDDANNIEGNTKRIYRVMRVPDEVLDAYNIKDSFDLSLNKVKDKDQDYTYDYEKFLYTLKKRLNETASNFKLGENFSKIKDEVLDRKLENIWSTEVFHEVCKKYDPKIDVNNIELLKNYLSDISVILYFKEREELKNRIFINPVWISEQIYKVLDSKVLQNSGHFKFEHVKNKLNENTLANDFIALMKQFQIIFEDIVKKEFIVPQYLPDTNTNRFYDMIKSKLLKLRFVLEFPKFLPKTIMNTILSIYAGKSIESAYYKYGVAFETPYAKINIIEYNFKKDQVCFYSDTDDQFNSREIFETILSLFENIKISDSNLTSMDTYTESNLLSEKVIVLLSLDGETFVNWNKLFLSRSKLQEHEVLIPERGKEINAGAFRAFYLSKDDVKNFSNPTMKKEPVKLFISYSHKDEIFKDDLIEHLSGLKRQGIIQHWTDRAILPGEKWDDSIKKNLNESQIILFLMSPSFMASDYIQDNEIKLTLERAKRPDSKLTIIPIPIRPCDFTSSPLKDYQSAVKDFKAVSLSANKDEAWVSVIEILKNLINEKFGNIR